MAKIGDKVRVPWREDNGDDLITVPDLLGYIESINGGYHYAKIVNNKKYDVIELYDGEYKIMDIWDPGYDRVQDSLMRKALADGERLRLERKRAADLMDELNIPHASRDIDIVDLYQILSDSKKCKNLISKLKLKAFW